MSRYVLRYTGTLPSHGSESGVDTLEVVLRAGAKVLDDAPDMLLVEANASVARTLEHLLPQWQIAAEATTPVPGVPRPALRPAARSRRR
ncbi:MAG TPA: hypothetical protein VFL64_03440 [Rhizobacter sp.]|nr:hypothetical protein [Rhizobacter sp.]